tara:strand:+ start:1282 stop:1644 length:363 start_codon:yes stop_codon:yes gene_type:complete
MLAALLTNLEPVFNGSSTGRRRRPGEKFVTQDEYLKAQEQLTALKDRPSNEQKAVTAKAIDAIKASKAEDAQEAQAYLADYDGALDRLENLEIVLTAYFMLQLRKRQEDDAAAMIMLGIL